MASADRTVFVIESDPVVADSLKALLDSNGLGIVSYGTGEEFAAAYRPNGRACLLIDVDPLSDGPFGLLELLRADGIDIPVVLIAWEDDAGMAQRATQAGVVALLEKPLTDALLLEAIENAFARK